MSDKIAEPPQVIFCDMCTEEERRPAQKTCMKCEISMCLDHLQAHLTTPVLLQTHPLTEPTALCGTTKCPHHGKLLEYYCLDDLTCVCVSCAIEDQHRLHNMKTFSTAHKELLGKLQQDKAALRMKVKANNTDIKKWEKTEGEKVRSCGKLLIEAVTHLSNLALKSVQSSVSGRMVALKTSESSMEAAQNEKDTFRFLQKYSQVHQDVEKAKAVDLRYGLEPSADREALIQQLRQGGQSMLTQGNHFLRALLTLVDPESHQNLDGPYSNLAFQPMSSGTISLSSDRRMLFYSSNASRRNVSHGSNASQFPITLQITGNNLQSTGIIHKWRVHFSKDCDWTTGLCDKKHIMNNLNKLVYAVSCDGDQLSFLTGKEGATSSTPITLQAKSGDQGTQRPRLVEVEWCFFGTTSLSFYNRIGEMHREKIFTHQMSLNSWDLVPFVRITQVQNTSQQEWQCCCREKDVNKMQMNGRCSCGAPLYDAVTIKKICELQ